MKGHRVPDETRALIRELWSKSLTYREIANRVGWGRSTVYHVLKGTLTQHTGEQMRRWRKAEQDRRDEARATRPKFVFDENAPRCRCGLLLPCEHPEQVFIGSNMAEASR